MSEAPERQYLPDVPVEIQDLLYADRGSEAVELLMKLKGQGKMQSAMELARISMRMKEAFPDALTDSPGLGSGASAPAGLQTAIGWLVMGLLLVAGLVFTGVGVYGLSLGVVSQSWPTTEGVVLQSKVEHRRPEVGEDKSSTYFARVKYDFSVDGQRYEGDRVSSSDAGRGRAKHVKPIVDRYPKGKSVTVYYKPTKPSRCLLEPGVQAKAFVFPSIGLFILSIFTLFCVLIVRDKRKSPDDAVE